MRYVLLILGLLFVIGGMIALGDRGANATPDRVLVAQAGIVFLAVGMATIDIVEAIRRKRE